MGVPIGGQNQDSALWRSLTISVLYGILYFVLARFPLLFLPAPDTIAAVWPASGLLVGALLVTPLRAWTWILFGIAPANFLANFLAGKGALVCLGFLLSDIGVHSLVVFAVVRHLSAAISLSRLSDVGVFALFIAALGAALSALGGAATALVGIGVEDFGTLWRVWCVSDFLGILAVAPPIIAWFQGGRFQGKTLTHQGLLEGMILLGALFAFSFSMFRHDVETSSDSLMFPFLLFPPVVLLAFRLGLRGVSIGGAIISLMAFWGTLQGKGPFSYLVGDIPYRILMLQGFLSILILSGLGIVAAISERKSAEAALRASEERFRGLFENASIGLYQTTPSGKILMANPALARMLGYSSVEELTARPLTAASFRLEDARSRFIEEIERQGEVRAREETWRTRDGGLVEVLENARAARDEEGRTLYYEGTVEDITERKRARKALEESERLYRNAIEIIGAVPYYDLYDPHRYVSIGEGVEVLTGYPAEEFTSAMLDKITLEVIPLGQLEGLPYLDAVAKARRDKGVSWRADYRIRARDGSEKWIADAAVQIRDEEGNAIGSLGILQDITERKLAEATLRESERLYRNAIEVAGAVPYYENYVEGHRYDFLGEGIEALTGVPVDEFTQEVLDELTLEIFPRGRLQNLPVEEAIELARAEEGLSWQADYHLRLRNGSERWLSNSAVQVRDREGKVIGSLGILQDITDRKMAEEAVRERERIYRSAIEVAGAAVYYQNYTTNFTYEFMGDQIETLTGYKKEEFTFDLWKSRTLETVLAGPLEGLTLEEAVQRARGMEGISWRADYRIRTKNGAEKWLANSAVQVRDRDGKVIGSLGILQDITERKVAEAAIRRSEQLYRNAIQAAGAVPYFRDKHTDRYEFLGDRIKELVGVSPEEFNGPRFDEIIQETILLENLRGLSIEDAVEKVERERDTRWRADYRIRRPDGEERWLSDAAVQVRDEKGEVIGSLGILTDTTDARRAEKELREALSRFEAIIENTPHVAIQGFDRNGLIRHWNSASETFYGHSAETALGQTIQDLLQMGAEREEFKRILAEIWDSGEPIPPREWTVRGREGEELCVYSTMFPIFSSGEVIEVFCMDVDITESKRAEEERRRLEAQIHHTQKLESLGVLAGGIAHDFNNLLMGVLGNASLALLELSPESPARESVAQIETAALRAADLAKQMLAYSGKGKFVVQRINLSKLVEEMSHLVEVSITKKAVLRYHFAENIPAIEADATQIRQVILNLITNASDALGTKSGIITVNTGVMEVDAEYLSSTYLDDELPPGHYVYIEVSDTGCGMDEETRAKIFDPFFTTKFTGRGLGLAAVLGIVRGHKGAIKVYSQLGIGTTFKVLFPATDQRPEDPTPPDSQPREAWRATGTILVVDDEETVRVVSKRMLEACGLSVLCARDGAEGVEMFRERPMEITLVLLDMTMPRMSGEEAFREMRRIRPDVRVVLTSGYNEQEATTRFAGKGLAGFIQKPFTHASLLDKVREVLEAGA